MGSITNINLEELHDVHVGLEEARLEVGAISPCSASRSSKSVALDEFEDRIEEFGKFLTQYNALLKQDSEKLKKAVLAFQELDKKEAKKYSDSITKSLKKETAGGSGQSCPVAGSAGGVSSGGGSR